jgi:delta-aminolevulinic acid dehydratase/porphobilinogen synthase
MKYANRGLAVYSPSAIIDGVVSKEKGQMLITEGMMEREKKFAGRIGRHFRNAAGSVWKCRAKRLNQAK